MPARTLLLALLLTACDGAPDDTGTADDTGGDSAGPDDTGWEGPCPPNTIQVADFCIDAYEPTITGDLGYADQLVEFPGTATTGVASSEAGVLPTEPTSWYQARGACLNAGKHLCTVDEWLTACGEGAFPWGDEPLPQAVCAVPAEDGAPYPDGLQPTGSLPDCRSPSGIFDQIGNAWEWADPGTFDDEGAPLTAKLGGAWYSGQGNTSCRVDYVTEHAPWFEGTIVGRCCVAAREGR